MTRVVGLDLSTTSTGIAHADGRLEAFRPHSSLDDADRRAEIASMASLAAAAGADLVVIESLPSLRAHAIVVLAKLHGVVEHYLNNDLPALPILWIAPNQRAGFATGSAQAKKPEVIDAALAEGAPIPDSPKGPRGDLADAFWLRAIGLAYRGNEWIVEQRPHRIALVDKLTGVAA